jgi:hypothetical protein
MKMMNIYIAGSGITDKLNVKKITENRERRLAVKRNLRIHRRKRRRVDTGRHADEKVSCKDIT